MTYDVIVIGVGAMGSAVCCELARRGSRVLGIDRFSIPNAMGSSHGESRAMRLCYYEHPDYVPLLLRAHEQWRELDAQTSAGIFEMAGALYMGAGDSELVAGSVRSALAHDLPHEVLAADALRLRYPQFNVADDVVGIYEPTGGFLRPSLAIRTWATLARAHGAELYERTQVLGWTAGDGGVEVQTTDALYRADTLVLTAGAWSGELLGPLGTGGNAGVPLVVTRNVMGWISPGDPSSFAIGRFPVWGIEEASGDFFYGFPLADGGSSPGLKIARHGGGEVLMNADALDRTPHAYERSDLRAACQRLLHGGDDDVTAMRVCMYTNTPDMHFWIDHHPLASRVIVAAGFSGHGFKFAPVIGEAIADLALDNGTDLPIRGFASRRRGR